MCKTDTHTSVQHPGLQQPFSADDLSSDSEAHGSNVCCRQHTETACHLSGTCHSHSL